MSSTTVFDLGLRLRAATTGDVQPRLQGTPFAPVAPMVAVDASPDGTVTVHHDGHAPTSGHGADGLRPLIPLVPRETSDTERPMVTLVVRSRSVVRKLLDHARTITPAADPGLFTVGALLAWWEERLDHPDTQAAIVVPDACRQRWATGEHPDTERDLDTWVDWLHIDQPTITGAALAAARLLRTGTPLPGTLDSDGRQTNDDRWSWSQLGRSVGAGRDWRSRDSQTRQVLGLLTRNTSAEAHDRRLLNDVAWQARGRWDGTAVHGQVTAVGTTATIRSHQTDCKLKVGRPIELVGFRDDADGRRLGLPVVATGLDTDPTSGEVTVQALNRSKAGLLAMFVVGDQALLLPSEVAPASQIRKRRTVSDNLQRPHWTRTGSAAPSRVARDVPLDVIVAAHG